ncbi:GNAT family N-acetyltransferase [Paenibacillus sp. XY044]|uniref:GNAT family N-acetyltransferase n=1 Tax=Paenibacillus sp. XY044 TaxID=2026089 RepID=UPI000B98A6D9|nr:GNAT family N-acetyltransferase [Paenibacillus sp. XY044]OZB97712.1 hypothetical protein CJP46_00610 [Paenibacillus sp. XY044]
MRVESWSASRERYELERQVILLKAELADWNRYFFVYSNPAYTGFFRDDGSMPPPRSDPFWICRDEEIIGGVVIAPNVLEKLFFIPPFADWEGIVRQLADTLLHWSDRGRPVTAYGMLPDLAELLAGTGFWPGVRRRWMQRPTSSFEQEPDDAYETASVVMHREGGSIRIGSDTEIALFLHRSLTRRTEALRGRQASFSQYVAQVQRCARASSTDTAAASSLVYDRRTHALTGVCLISMRQGLPFVDSLMVHPGYSRRGIATAMVKRALTLLNQRGYPLLRLRVTEGNPAESVFRRLGFMAAPPEVSRMFLGGPPQFPLTDALPLL